MVKSYYYDKTVNDWLELVQGERGERGEQGPPGNVNIEAGETPFTIDNSVGTRVFVGDTMIHGETPWYNIHDQLAVDGSPTSRKGPSRIKRIGSTIYLSVSADNVTMNAWEPLLFIPEGWRFGEYDRIFAYGADGNTGIGFRVLGTTTSVQPMVPLNSGSPVLEIAYVTSLPWPSEAPGPVWDSK